MKMPYSHIANSHIATLRTISGKWLRPKWLKSEAGYPVPGEKIFYVPDVEMTEEIVSWEYPLWKAKAIGGYALPWEKEIYIKESRRGDIKLLNHERGHLRGFRHTRFPTLMASSWVYRWFNRYFPPYEEKQ